MAGRGCAGDDTEDDLRTAGSDEWSARSDPPALATKRPGSLRRTGETEPREAVELISRYLRYRANLRALGRGDSEHVAVILRGAELVLPASLQGDFAIASLASLVRDWAAEPPFCDMAFASLLLADNLNDLHPTFTRFAVGEGIEEAIAELKAAHPRIEFKLVSTAIDEIRASFSSSMAMLWEGAALAVLVVWWFLRDWRATWISALALPLSIIPTFGVIWILGFSLNMITLLALAVVVGILVDDAIVEVENIDRHLAMGKSPKVAATEAADEIGLAVIATSATLAAVFIPVAFMPGVAGKFFLEFGWTAATAVMFSLMVARLLTPMMAAYQLKPKPHVEKESALMKRYLRMVEWALANRFKTLGLALLMFIGSLALLPLIPRTFIPGSDLGRSNLSLELPPGARLDQTAAMSERARALVADMPELRQAYATVGGVLDLGDPAVNGIGEVRKVTMVLDWGPEGERERTQKELEREVRKRLEQLPGVRQRFLSSEPGEQLMLVLSGDDPARLYQAAGDFESRVAEARKIAERLAAKAKYYDVARELVAYARTVKVGNGMEAGTELGPLQNKMQYDKVKGFLADAHANGTVIAGGMVEDRPGYFIRPTIVARKTHHIMLPATMKATSHSACAVDATSTKLDTPPKIARL